MLRLRFIVYAWPSAGCGLRLDGEQLAISMAKDLWEASEKVRELFRQASEASGMDLKRLLFEGSEEELKLMLSLVRPRCFVPIHGEYRHLVYHAKLARKVGIPEENIFIIENGEVMEFTENSARRAGVVNVGRVYIDGKTAEDVAAELGRACPDGIDVVFDNVGEAVIENGFKATAYNGRYVMMGFASNKVIADEKGRFHRARSRRGKTDIVPG